MPDPVPCREQVVLAARAAIDALVSVPGLKVDRDRSDEEPVTIEEIPLAALREGDESVNYDFTGQDDYALELVWDLYARNAAELVRLRAVIQAAMLTDAALIGLTIRVTDAGEAPPEPNRFMHMDPAIKAGGRLFLVEYATLENDPFTFA